MVECLPKGFEQKMNVLVVGAGQVGSALASVLKRAHNVTLWDVEAKNKIGTFDVLHICYPYSSFFVKTTTDYIKQFSPKLTLIESTVKPNTTQQIHEKSPTTLVCHSPIRGCHNNLIWGITDYTKFVGPTSRKAGLVAERYYKNIGLKTYVAKSSKETEIAKLLNLSYFATQIAFFQEAERYIKQYEANYDDVLWFLKTTTIDSKGEVQRPILKGDFIGGHCVMKGLKLAFEDTELWTWILNSNEKMRKKNDGL